ncbi:hypothetical protein [Acetobacter estunensis]|uniref:hypothetical protein n=1 Tax=Acetobacter estunensis TaxID=104097 RepID=UPI0020C55CC4|nr:hypothetical protein [Acetobacter estunensis]
MPHPFPASFLPRSRRRDASSTAGVKLQATRRHVLRGGLIGGAGFLAGCKLLDQRTFDPNASRPPKVYIPPPPPGPPPIPPLIEVMAGTPRSQWESAVQTVTRKALDRKPNILFLVRVLAPPGTSEDATRDALQRVLAEEGQPIADTIVGAGADPAQVEMSAMPDSSVASPRVQVYVR